MYWNSIVFLISLFSAECKRTIFNSVWLGSTGWLCKPAAKLLELIGILTLSLRRPLKLWETEAIFILVVRARCHRFYRLALMWTHLFPSIHTRIPVQGVDLVLGQLMAPRNLKYLVSERSTILCRSPGTNARAPSASTAWIILMA